MGCFTEKDRLRTFARWPLRGPPYPLDLVKAGFYYTGPFDEVTCAYCLGVVGHWKVTDDPLEVHQKFFPDCIMVRKIEQSRATNRGTLENQRYVYRESQLAANPIQAPASQPTFQNNFQPSTSSTQTYLNIQSTYNRPQVSGQNSNTGLDYTKEENRLKSFHNWTGLIDSQGLARAGFYYLGNRDRVQCFSCKTVFKDWTPGDDPWIEHCKWYADCKYIKLCLGDDVVEDIHKQMSKLLPDDDLEIDTVF